MVEVWFFYRDDYGTFVEVRKFNTRDEADKYIKYHRDGRSVVFVENLDDRANVLRMIGARVHD